MEDLIIQEIDGTYRLRCDGCSSTDGPRASTRQALEGLIWFCTDAHCEQQYQARQRASLKLELMKIGVDEEIAEDEVQKLRWDLMPDGRSVDPPSQAVIEQQETKLRVEKHMRPSEPSAIEEADGTI